MWAQTDRCLVFRNPAEPLCRDCLSREREEPCQQRHRQRLTHEVGGGLAHSTSKDEILEQVGDEVEGHAEKTEHEVTDSQGQQEDVGDGPHPLVPNQHCDDQRVPQHTEEEDQGVEENLHSRLPLCRGTGKSWRHGG